MPSCNRIIAQSYEIINNISKGKNMIHKATEIRKAIESRDYRAASYITGKAATDYAKQIIEFIGPIRSSEILAVIAALHVVEISVLSPLPADFVRDTKCAADEIVKSVLKDIQINAAMLNLDELSRQQEAHDNDAE